VVNMLRDSSLEPRLLRIRNKIWGKYLPPISESTGIPIGVLSLVERNRRKRLNVEQYEALERYIEEQRW
jgi:hypothetical protein